MKKRLEITLFGKYHVVGVVKLSLHAAKEGVSVFGQRKWHDFVGDIALGVAATKTIQNVNSVLGFPLRPQYQISGFALSQHAFGVEAFHGGEFSPFSTVAAQNRVVSPQKMLQECQTGDVLVVFRASCEHTILFQWLDVPELSEGEVCFKHDSLSEILGMRAPFDLVYDVTWKEKRGLVKRHQKRAPLQTRQYLFHKKK